MITGLTIFDDHLTIKINDQNALAYHYLWLRHHCRCDACVHPQTRETLVDPFGMPADISPSSSTLSDDHASLQLEWPEGHSTQFTEDFLRDNAYSENKHGDDFMARGLPKPKPWTSETTQNPPTIEAAQIKSGDAGLKLWLEQLYTDGCSIVTGLEAEDGALEKLCRRISFLRETNFGVGFSVVSLPNPNNVAYTPVELKAHVDLPNREMPPGIQFLHCIHNESTGGESLLVDGFAAALMLKEKERSAFDLLATTPISFRFVDEGEDIRWTAPVIGMDHLGGLQQIRYHMALSAPLNLPFEKMTSYYDALRKFTECLRDPSIEMHLKLKPGEVMCFHNRRVLHGRSAFDPNTGKRYLKGCYVDCDDAWSKLRVLNGFNEK